MNKYLKDDDQRSLLRANQRHEQKDELFRLYLIQCMDHFHNFSLENPFLDKFFGVDIYELITVSVHLIKNN